jgi:predicted negative regulator of RcsB-dependent stress response
LRNARELEHNKGKEQERYRNAQKSLSTLDRHLTKGKFDKGDLDQAIEDIQNVLDHNTLQSSSRDALLSDIQNLRMARKAM